MRKDIENVVSKYIIYTKAKIDKYKLYSTLRVIALLDKGGKQYTIDFVIGLPNLIELYIYIVYNTILVVIDKLTKFRQFLLVTKDIIVDQLAYIIERYVLATTRLLESYIINKDKLFTSNF